MPPKLRYKRISLNQIRDHSEHPILRKTNGMALIRALLPQWWNEMYVPFTAGNARANIDLFCGGNVKKNIDSLGNTGIIDDIVSYVNSDAYADFVGKALNLSRSWLETMNDPTRVNKLFAEQVPLLQSEYIETSDSATACEFITIERTIAMLREENTTESLSYALFLLVMVGVLQKRIVLAPSIYKPEKQGDSVFLKKILSPDRIQALSVQNDDLGESSAEFSEGGVLRMNQGGYLFVKETIQNYSTECIECVDMAFHGGDHWLTDGEKVALLDDILTKGIRLRVLVNTKEAVEVICAHMRQRRRKYMGFDDAIIAWKEWECDFPNLFEVRVLDIPLLHRMYLVRKTDGKGAANITTYTYGNYRPENDFRLNLNENDPGYSAFAAEFDYLWNIAHK